MFCEHCGTKIEEGAEFCQSCGKKTSTMSDAVSSAKVEQQATRGQKVGAFFLGWLGAGLLWGVGSSIGTSAHISTDSSLGILGELIGLILVIVVWVKIYRHYVDKWAEKNNQRVLPK